VDRSLSCIQPCFRSSVALPLGINGKGGERHLKASRGTFIGVLCGPKPAGPKTSVASCGPPLGEASARATLRAAKAIPHLPHNSLNFGLSPTPSRRGAPRRQGRRFAESRYSLSVQVDKVRATQRVAKALPICFRPQPAENEYGARAEYFGPPHPGAAGRPLTRGLSYSLSAQSTDKSTAQSSPQFSAPCRPHCGSACAPPCLPSLLGFHLDFAIAKRVKSLFTQVDDGIFARHDANASAKRAPLSKAEITLTKHPMGAWTGNARAFPLSVAAESLIWVQKAFPC